MFIKNYVMYKNEKQHIEIKKKIHERKSTMNLRENFCAENYKKQN